MVLHSFLFWQELDIEKKSLIDEFAAAADAQVVDNILEEPKENINEETVKKPDANDADASKDFKGPQNDRQRAVVAAFKHAWKGYKQFAWGHDNLRPISMGSSDWFGLGLTIVDSLDTIYIMDLQEGKITILFEAMGQKKSMLIGSFISQNSRRPETGSINI